MRGSDSAYLAAEEVSAMPQKTNEPDTAEPRASIPQEREDELEMADDDEDSEEEDFDDESEVEDEDVEE